MGWVDTNIPTSCIDLTFFKSILSSQYDQFRDYVPGQWFFEGPKCFLRVFTFGKDL